MMNLDAKRYYALLGLDPACSDEDIRVAFRRRAKQLHPDAESGDATAFMRVKRAYDTLADPARRAQYDRANRARMRRETSDLPTPPRARPHRSGGMSFARYVIAFLFVGGLSLAAVETMISYADAPPAGSAGPVSLLSHPARNHHAKDDSRLGDRTAASGPGSGFWDPSNPNSSSDPSGGSSSDSSLRDSSLRDSGANDGGRSRSNANGIGGFSSD